MSQRSSRATPKGAKKAKRSKHDELEARPPPLRGDDAKENDGLPLQQVVRSALADVD